MPWWVVGLSWSVNCVINSSTGTGTFVTTDTKLFLSVVTKFTKF